MLVKHLAVFTWLGTREGQTRRTHLAAFRLCLEIVRVALTTSVRKLLARARVVVEVPSREGSLARAGQHRHSADCYQTMGIHRESHVSLQLFGIIYLLVTIICAYRYLQW